MGSGSAQILGIKFDRCNGKMDQLEFRQSFLTDIKSSPKSQEKMTQCGISGELHASGSTRIGATADDDSTQSHNKT